MDITHSMHALSSTNLYHIFILITSKLYVYKMCFILPLFLPISYATDDKAHHVQVTHDIMTYVANKSLLLAYLVKIFKLFWCKIKYSQTQTGSSDISQTHCLPQCAYISQQLIALYFSSLVILFLIKRDL